MWVKVSFRKFQKEKLFRHGKRKTIKQDSVSPDGSNYMAVQPAALENRSGVKHGLTSDSALPPENRLSNLSLTFPRTSLLISSLKRSISCSLPRPLCETSLCHVDALLSPFQHLSLHTTSPS